MKFKKLMIHNIASIEDAEINFEQEPLKSSEVFLITGKTGAGKSTILDAICLALYDNTPRLADSVKTTGKMADLLVDEKMYINSTRQLLRRNAGEAWVTLTFTGSDGVEYEAMWSVKRAGKKQDGKIQDVKRSLTNLDANEQLTRKGDINNLVEGKAVGLTFEQFCRTTMLAQGEFTKFLKSNEEDKSQILEHITGTDIYTRIGKKIYQMSQEKKKKYEQLCKEAEDKQGLTEEELAERNEELNRNGETLKQLTGQKTSFDNKVKWLNDDAELNGKQLNAQEELVNAQAKMDSDEVKEAQKLVGQWNATIEVRGLLRQQREAEQNVKRTESNLDKLSKDYATMKGGHVSLQKAIEEKKAKAAQIVEALEKQADKADVFAEHQAIETLLQNIIDGQGSIKKDYDKEQSLKQRLEGELTQSRKSAAEKHQLQKEKVDGLHADVKQKEDAFEQTNLQALNEKQLKLVDRKQQLQAAMDKRNAVDKVRQDREKESTALDELKNSITALEKQENELTQQVHDADVTQKDRQRTFELIEAQTQNWAKTIRGKLKENDICPVCFQKITSPIHDDGIVNDIYEQARKNVEEAKNIYDSLSKQLNQVSSECKVNQSSYTKRKDAFDKDHSLEEAERQASEALEIVGIDAENANAVLKEQMDKNNVEMDIIQKKIKEGNQLQTALNNARKNLEKEKKELEKLKNVLDSADEALEKCRADIKATHSLLEDHVKTCEKNKESVANKLQNVGDWAAGWEEHPETFKKKLHQAAINYERLQREKDELAQAIATNSEMMRRVENQMKGILEKCPQWNNLQPTTCEGISLESAVNSLHQSVTQQTSYLKQYRENVDTLKEQVDNYLAGHDFSVEQLKGLDAYTKESIDLKDRNVKDADNNLREKKTLVERAKKEYEEHRQHQPDIQEGETIESLGLLIAEIDSNMSELQQRQGAIHQQLKDNDEKKKERESLEKKIEDARKEQDRWGRLNKYFGDAEGKDFRTIAQSYVLAQLINSANEYMKHLTDRYSLYIKPGSFAVYMEDAYQGYVRRPSSTISGGESFLVSLALALALSDIDQRQSADILFIDEGFGTLSGAPLANAIDTLRTLQSKSGRRVGIISHIDELREKLPVQIHVDQASRNSKSTVAVAG